MSGKGGKGKAEAAVGAAGGAKRTRGSPDPDEQEPTEEIGRKPPSSPVSVQLHAPNTVPGAHLPHTKVEAIKGPNGSEYLPAHRPAPLHISEMVHELALPTQEWPTSYVSPHLPYRLVQEPDKRWRLLGPAEHPAIHALTLPRPHVGGDDNRKQVGNTTVWPWTVHGHVIITFPDNAQYIGSGTMVFRHHVITAGHVVYSKKNGGWAKSIQFNAAQNGSSLPFGTAWATRLYSFYGWTNDENPDYDTGLLILNQELGDRTGYMGLIKGPDSIMLNHSITVSGYPGDKGGQTQWQSAGPIVKTPTEQLWYNAFTKGGDSGSGVFGTWSGVSLEHVCADHTRGPNGIPNGGSRFADDKWPAMIGWLNA